MKICYTQYVVVKKIGKGGELHNLFQMILYIIKQLIRDTSFSKS